MFETSARKSCIIYFTLVISHLFQQPAEAKFMKIHNSKLDTILNCNDHFEKLWLSIDCFDVNMCPLIDELEIFYNVIPCQDESEYKCDRLKNLTLINWQVFNNKKQPLIIQLNSFYKYKFDMTVKYRKNPESNLSNDKNNTYLKEKICQNLDYVKFGGCDQYRLGLDEGLLARSGQNCSLTLIKNNETRSFIKYIYFGLFLTFIICIVSKISKVLFTKYRIIK